MPHLVISVAGGYIIVLAGLNLCDYTVSPADTLHVVVHGFG